MYTYTLQSERQVIDYYGIDHDCYPEEDWRFSDASIWVVRRALILYLIRKQGRSTAVDYAEISISLSAKGEEESTSVGAWTLFDAYKK